MGQLGHLASSLLEVVSQTIGIKVSLDAAGLGALVRLIGRVGVPTKTLPSFGTSDWTSRRCDDGFIEGRGGG